MAAALQTFTHASAQQQLAWEDAYTKALEKATTSLGQVFVPQGDYGPLPTMMNHLLTLGTSGALDGLLLRSGGFYQNDFTKPLLFLSEDALPTRAEQLNLLGSQWGMMNETGNYPGQAWLWLYTFWYQIPPYNTSSNGDALVWVTMAVLTLLLVVYPYLPYLNRLPYYLGVHVPPARSENWPRMRVAVAQMPQTSAAQPALLPGFFPSYPSAGHDWRLPLLHRGERDAGCAYSPVVSP